MKNWKKHRGFRDRETGIRVPTWYVHTLLKDVRMRKTGRNRYILFDIECEWEDSFFEGTRRECKRYAKDLLKATADRRWECVYTNPQ